LAAVTQHALRIDPSDQGGSGTRILVVDDEPDVRAFLVRALESLDYSIDATGNGTDALARVRTRPYDAIISDLRMPGIGGLELLRAIREHDLDVPVILLTGAPDFQTAVEAVEYGAFRYLVKPVDIDVLLDTVRRAVMVHRVARLRREAMDLVALPRLELGDRASLQARFSNALAKLYMAFQPIVHCKTRSVLAYEALVRSEEPALANPVGLLDAAERLGRSHELGRRIRAAVAEAASDAPPDALLFVNLNAAELNDNELLSAQAPLSRISARVVLEVTERSALDRVDGLMTRRRKLRDLGFRVAIDDLGAGYAGLSSFSQLDPEFVKLDRSLVQNLHEDPRRLKIVQGMAELCRQLGMHVICEGVETRHERDALTEAGLELLQGYLFARPERGFPSPSWD
jgi:EAL domain-containing protein (putative c-di-GMP-specific phosphodiesterase class I)